jgi:methylmalonyl-CoA mutase N-terminal domain/subunit
MIITKERGLNFNENPWQGSFVVGSLTPDIGGNGTTMSFANVIAARI